MRQVRKHRGFNSHCATNLKTTKRKEKKMKALMTALMIISCVAAAFAQDLALSVTWLIGAAVFAFIRVLLEHDDEQDTCL